MLPKIIADKKSEVDIDEIVANKFTADTLKCECGKNDSNYIFIGLLINEKKFKPMCQNCCQIKSNQMVCLETASVYERRRAVGFYTGWRVVRK